MLQSAVLPHSFYLFVQPVDFHSHRLGEKFPSALQLRLVQLPPGVLELLIRELQRHDSAADLETPAAVSSTAGRVHTTLPVRTFIIKALKRRPWIFLVLFSVGLRLK